MAETRYEVELETAREAAKRAADMALRFQSEGIVAETKSDDSPVTAADRASERLIAGMLEETFPDDGILGEEGARKASKSGRRWIIDPIDGTRDFVRGNPLWGVLIGLEDAGEVVAGVVYLPILRWMSWGSRGEGSYRNGTRLRVSDITDPGSAVLSMNGLNRIREMPVPNPIDWMARFWSIRSMGGTPDAMMLAAGQVDLWIEPKVAAWDLAAPQVILEEAGAVFCDLTGKRTIYGGSAIACAPGLEAELKAFLAKS